MNQQRRKANNCVQNKATDWPNSKLANEFDSDVKATKANQGIDPTIARDRSEWKSHEVTKQRRTHEEIQ